MNNRKARQIIGKLAVFMLLFSFVFNPLAPVFAQTNDSGSADSSDTSTSDAVNPEPAPEVTPPEQSEEVPPVDSTPAPAPEQEEEQGLDPPVVPLEQATLPPTKFKKDNSLSQQEQLAKVRQHILDNKLPQAALDRLNAYEAEMQEGPKEEGIFEKVFDFVTNNTDAAKEKKEAIEFAKREPFKVETFEGKINTAVANDSLESKEEGGFIQKVKDFIKGGGTVNLDIEGAKKQEGTISSLFGVQEAYAASDNPNDYLAAGAEVTFSQEIKDKANALGNDPLKMLNFVRNEVKYVPYYGSKKGSDATLVELAGNDMDQSSLLIAMLRYSNIPARYRHVNAKMDINTVTELLGVNSALAAAKVMSLEKIPYILYTLNGDPYFFVVEHTYVETYMPYGYSRGVDKNDGGTPQWVPMDPTINGYEYEQLVNVIGKMNSNGFNIEDFFKNYLEGDYNSLEPLDAFKSEVEARLAAITPEYYSNFTYNDALTHLYTDKRDLNFIPGSLTFSIWDGDGNTLDNIYDYIPNLLRHTIKFTIKDNNNSEVLNYTSYVSDLADKELLVTYDAATSADQTIINTFATIYDVVPLSIVSVKPVLKIKGNVVATGSASTTLGKSQKYTMEFNTPKRIIGTPVSLEIIKTIDKDILTGNTDAIALDTDRVIPPELRPKEDTGSSSYLSSQVLYRTAVSYLDGLQYTQAELADIIGGDFTHVATSAAISNGITVTYSGGQPYSFDWKGLRIDASAKVRYFSRFDDTITKNKKEFTSVFGLQASQDESDIFEDNFNVKSVATVKGLKLVSSSTFPGVTMKKITSANESDIDSLNISSSSKTVFHTAVGEGKTVYTPSAAITYGSWQGLFYILIDFADGDATYAIGEGLNGGYSVCGLPGVGSTLCNWTQNLIDILVPQAEASGWNAEFISISPISAFVGQKVTAVIKYTKGTISRIQNFYFKVTNTGPQKITAPNDTSVTATVNVSAIKLGDPDNKKIPVDPKYDDLFIANAYSSTSPQFKIPADLVKNLARHESGVHFDLESYRYEPCLDAHTIRPNTTFHYSTYYPWANYWISDVADNGTIFGGAQVNEVKNDAGKRPWEFKSNIMFPLKFIDYDGNHHITVFEIWKANEPVQHYNSNDNHCSLTEAEANFAPQLLISASYGPGQTLYTTAVTDNNFDTTPGVPPTTGQKSNDIRKFFVAKLAIPLIVEKLKSLFIANIGLTEGCTSGKRTWTVLRKYNGGESNSVGSQNYATEICTWWSVDKTYSPHIFDTVTGKYIPYTF